MFAATDSQILEASDHFRRRIFDVQVELFIKIRTIHLQRSSHCILTVIDPFVQLARNRNIQSPSDDRSHYRENKAGEDLYSNTQPGWCRVFRDG